MSKETQSSYSLLKARLKKIKRQIEENGYDIKEESDTVLLVGFPGDYFCAVTLYENENLIGVGFDLTTYPQDAAILTLIVNSNAPTALMQPHYHSKDGKTYFGEAAYEAYDEDFIRSEQMDEYDPNGAA